MSEHLVREPVYQQLYSRLHEILRRDYARDDRFLTEREISRRFEVSRATANKALASLVSEGTLEFIRGVGTFVRRTPIDYDVHRLVSFTEKAREAGRLPSTRIVAFARTTADEIDADVRQRLRAEGKEPLWEIERVRLADRCPVILERRLVVARYCQSLTRADVGGSLYEAWRDLFKLVIDGADVVIRAVRLTKVEARHLGIRSGAAALEVVSVGFVSGGAPLWWERTVYRADQYEFHSHLGPVQSGTPASGRLRLNTTVSSEL